MNNVIYATSTMLMLFWALAVSAEVGHKEHTDSVSAPNLTLDGEKKWRADEHT